MKSNTEIANGFNNWMANVVKSIHYADNEKMTNAFQRLSRQRLKQHNYIFNINQ